MTVDLTPIPNPYLYILQRPSIYVQPVQVRNGIAFLSIAG